MRRKEILANALPLAARPTRAAIVADARWQPSNQVTCSPQSSFINLAPTRNRLNQSNQWILKIYRLEMQMRSFYLGTSSKTFSPEWPLDEHITVASCFRWAASTISFGPPQIFWLHNSTGKRARKKADTFSAENVKPFANSRRLRR